MSDMSMELPGFRLPGTTSAGSTIDIQILRDLFGHYVEAAKLLGIDSDFRQRVLDVRRRLPPMQVGKRGNSNRPSRLWRRPGLGEN